MMAFDPGALTGAVTIAGSVAVGLLARRGLSKLDQIRDERNAEREQDEPVAGRPLIRPAIPAGGRH